MNKHMQCPFEKIYPSQLKRDDLFFMRLAYNLAIDAWNDGEVPIGAVIEYKGEIIASAYNRVEKTKDPTAHAEVLAITQAAHYLKDWRLNDANLYVTKEPCPMCAGASIMARLSSVTFAVGDTKMGCLGGVSNTNNIPSLNHHLTIKSGILESDCLLLLKSFFELKRTKITLT